MFVTFEGPEGAGKSTAIQAVADALMARGRSVFVTREPGGGPSGPAIRQVLLHGESLGPEAELFLFLADRADHVDSTVRPALLRGDVVLCDRFADSTLVYQGYARGLDLDRIRNLNSVATGGLVPDLTLLLDLPAEAGLARLVSRDRLDAEPTEFHQRVRDGFLEEAKLDPARWRIIDAGLDPASVAQACLSAIDSKLAQSVGP